MPAMLMHFDEWPLVVIEPPRRAMSERDLTSVLMEYGVAVGQRPGPFATLCDLGETPGLTPPQRRMFAESLSRSDAAAQRCVAQAMVIRMPVARHTFTAVMWMSRPPFPVRVFDNASEARAWLRSQLPRAGHTARPRAVPA